MTVESIVKVSELEGAKRLDAEYYQPRYLSIISKLAKAGAIPLSNLLTEAIYGIYTEPDYLERGLDFVRGLNLREYGIEGEILKIREDALPNKKYLLKQGDLLIARSGNVGDVGIITKDLENATFGSYTIRLRTHHVSPYFLAIFLKTRFGRLQIERLSTQVAQPNVNVPNLKTVKVTIPDAEFQDSIKSYLLKSQQFKKHSESLYLQAEQMLLDELRWDKFSLSQPKSYVIPLSQANNVSRIDAEHFQPKYEKLLAHIRGETDILGDVILLNKRGLQPTYVEEGNVIVVNSQHLGRYLLNVEATERTNEEFWRENKRCQLKTNDILIYSTGAYVGRTNVWLEDLKAIASNHVNIIRPNEKYNPSYLAVYLNSQPGLWQAEMWASGSGQRELYPSDIARFILYRAPQQLQEKIADLVLQSYQARKKAKALLEEAKRKVEELIEKKGC